MEYASTNWSLDITPMLTPLVKRSGILGDSNGVFQIDTTLADTYTLDISDPNGSITSMPLNVIPDVLSMNLDPLSNTYFIA
jgi:hypothetical protein